MSFNVIGPGGPATGKQATPVAAGGSAGPVGEWNGLAATASDSPVSLIADAAGDLQTPEAEAPEIELSEKKKADKEEGDGVQRIGEVKATAGMLDRMKKRLAEKLQELLAAIRAAAGNPAAIRLALESAFPDPTERHFAMLWLEDGLSGEPSVAKIVRTERAKLEAAAAAEIQAGYNTDAVDAGEIGGRAEGRDCYRRTILGHPDIGQMLDSVLNRVGEGDFLQTVGYLRRAVGADLSAANPSTDKRELESLNNDLYHLRAIGNFTRDFGGAILRIREAAGKKPLPEAALSVLRLFAKVRNERLAALDGLRVHLALEGEKDPSYDVKVLTQTWRFFHRMPAKVFADEDSRQRLLDAGQRMLDAAVGLEESLAEDGDE